jgi:hypothetical protein
MQVRNTQAVHQIDGSNWLPLGMRDRFISSLQVANSVILFFHFLHAENYNLKQHQIVVIFYNLRLLVKIFFEIFIRSNSPVEKNFKKKMKWVKKPFEWEEDVVTT